MRVLSEQWTVRLGSYPGVAGWQRPTSKPRGHRSTLGASAVLQAATCVNPEQASKCELRTPTLPVLGEGRSAAGKQPSDARSPPPTATTQALRLPLVGRHVKRVRCDLCGLSRILRLESDGTPAPPAPLSQRAPDNHSFSSNRSLLGIDVRAAMVDTCPDRRRDTVDP